MMGPDPRILSRLADAQNNIQAALAMKEITQNDAIFQDHIGRAIQFLREAQIMCEPELNLYAPDGDSLTLGDDEDFLISPLD